MLSPTQGQVAHALLTRPPLIIPEGNHRSTWMCYARRQRSSWARIKLSNKLYQFTLSSVLIIRAIYSSLFYFLELCSLWFFDRFFFRTCFFCFVLSSSVVQLSSFNFAHRFFVSLSIISLLFSFVNRFLKNFSKIFSTFSRAVFRVAFRDSFIILPLYRLFVNKMRENFQKNWRKSQ